MTFRPAVTTSLTCALLVSTATLPLREVFGDWNWVAGVIGAAIAGAIAASISETLRSDFSLGVVASITALGAVTWALLVPLSDILLDDPISTTLWRELGHGLFGGWEALLEEQSPLPDPRAAEVFAAVLAWIAAAGAVHFAARRRSALGAVTAAAGVLWISTAAALPRGLTPAILGAGAGAMALLAISTVTRAPEQRWRLGRTLALVAMIGLAGGAATLAGSAADSLERDPFDPRSSRATEVIDVEVPDILAEFGVRRDQNTTVMSLEAGALPFPFRLRLQVYETHDGERWLPATGFAEFATVPGPAVFPPGDIVNLSVTVEDLDGPWVPLPDRLIRTDLTDLRWSEETQTALSTRATRRFEVTGTVVSRAGLEGLASARDEVPERLSRVPAGLPASVRTAAEEASADAADALATIDAITARLRLLNRDEATAPGNSFGRLRNDLATGQATGAEQIASLHALMLRAVGIPSRLVVGYVATSPTVVSADLQVWTEAAFRGIGWVPFDPVPAIVESGPDINSEPTATTTTVPEDAAVQARALPRRLDPGEGDDQPEIGDGENLTLGDTAILVVSVLVVLVLLLIVVRVSRRRSRKNSAWPAEIRVLGAWAEVVDRLRELGAPIADTTTIDDVVYMAAATDVALGEEVRELADLAAIALHGPRAPTAEEASLAWAQLRVVESRIVAVRGRRTVALRHLDPRVLRYRVPSPPPSRDGGRRSRF